MKRGISDFINKSLALGFSYKKTAYKVLVGGFKFLFA